MKKIAITGNVACGKSSVCQIFRELGATVVDADHIVHQLLEGHPQVIQKVKKLLGNDVVHGEHIDRAEVAKEVFNHPEKLASLEDILHPHVKKEIEHKYKEAQQSTIFAVEIPLLFEAKGFLPLFDTIIVVTAPQEICQQRFKRTKEEYRKREARLIPLKEKIPQADFVINNEGTLEALNQNVKTLFKELNIP